MLTAILKNMKVGGSHMANRGFTIVETLIVLAVTAALFLSTVTLLNGRQNKTQFITSINDLEQQFQQLINETESGYFPNAADFTCTSNLPNPPKIKKVTTSSAQGTNGACIFVGKALQLGTPHAEGTTAYTVYPLAAYRLYSGSPVSSLAQAMPVAVEQGTNNNKQAPTDLAVTTSLPGGLTYQGAIVTTTDSSGNVHQAGSYASGGATKTYIATIMSRLDDASVSGSSSQQFDLYSLSSIEEGWSSVQSNQAAADGIYEVAANDGYSQLTSTSLCFASGGTYQSGLITIGNSNGGGLAVSLVIHSGKQCGNA